MTTNVNKLERRLSRMERNMAKEMIRRSNNSLLISETKSILKEDTISKVKNFLHI